MIQNWVRSHAPVWRRELLSAAILGMESCVAAAWFVPLSTLLAPHRAGWTWLGLAGMIALAYLATRSVSYVTRSLRGQRLLTVGAIVASIVLFTRFHVYARIPLSSGAWAGQWLSEWSAVFHALGGAPIALAVILFCWWRGVNLAFRDMTLASVSFSFRFDVLLFIAAGLFWPSLSAAPAPLALGAGMAGLIYSFFFFAIMAQALARVDELAGREDTARAPFGVGWLSIVLGSGAVVVSLGWLFARLYSPAGMQRLGRWLAPLFNLIGGALYAVLVALLRLVGPLLDAIFTWLQRLMSRLMKDVSLNPVMEGLPITPTPTPTDLSQSAIPWMAIFKWSLIVGAVLFALLILALMLRRRKPQPERGSEAESVVLPSAWRDDLLANLRSVAEALGLLGRFGLGRDLYAALTIRHIYANMVRLAARRGFPRLPALTPYEYLPTLRQAFVGLDEDTLEITNAYVAVHYGEVPSSMEQLQIIRQRFERVRAAASTT